MNVLGYRLHVPIFCNSDIQPKLPEVCFVENALLTSSQASLPRHLYPGLQAASWAFSLCEAVVLKLFLFPSVAVSHSWQICSSTESLCRDAVMTGAASDFRFLGLCLATAGFGETVSMICQICCPEVSVVGVRTQS